MKDLRLAESKTNEIKDENKTEKLGTLLENKDKREKEIKDEKERGKDLDFKLQDWERKIRGKRKEIGGSNAGANFAAQSKKQEKVFENRLDDVIYFSFNKITIIILNFFF